MNVPSIYDIIEFCVDEISCFNWLKDIAILTEPEACRGCGGPLRVSDERKGRPLFRFRCRRKACQERISIYNNTFFMNCRIPCNQVMMLSYLWLCGASHKTIVAMTKLSSKSITQWICHTKQLLSHAVESNLEEDYMVGGPGIIVEVDESKFGKRKYNQGHHVEGVWVVGGVERTAERKCFAFAVENRSAPALLAVMQRFIRPGSIIYTDCWKGYTDVIFEEMGMFHDTVNHTYNWVDPITGVHTNTIEGTWSAMKWHGTPIRQRTRELVQANLFAFIWKRKNAGNEWEEFLVAMRDMDYVLIAGDHVEEINDEIAVVADELDALMM